MAEIKPFYSVRPREDLVEQIASLPYDVYNRKEAKQIVDQNPLSFLSIDRPETLFAPDVDMYSHDIYVKGRDVLRNMIQEGSYVREQEACYYIYALTHEGKTQRGIVAVSSIEDYMNEVIKKHENTRPDKEIDRTKHIDILEAQTGPIFMAFHTTLVLHRILDSVTNEEALYDFMKEGDVRHQVWRIQDRDLVKTITHEFAQVPAVYIADGHHRAQAACNVAKERRALNPKYTGLEEYNYFLTVSFPAEELSIMDYNRVIHDLNGHSYHEFIELLKQEFTIEGPINAEVKPTRKGEWGMYLGGAWYHIIAKEGSKAYELMNHSTAKRAQSLDVSILQERVLQPILGIDDPKTNDRIQFVGGIRGLKELEKLADASDGVAFAMFPTSMDELFAVSDAGELMPPKSTWFEPKLLSGIFIHEI